MATKNVPGFSWGSSDPGEWLRMWQNAWRGAPANLSQPILPGWTFNINSGNSSSPQTEADVIARHSYGRQLGRMADALELLISNAPGDVGQHKQFLDFLTMKEDIDEVKQDAAVARVERIIEDLAVLKTQNETQYARLRDALREALG